MLVREIDDIAGFESIRGDWDAAFERDPHASAFVSWSWLRGWFDVTPHPWCVLAARVDEHAPHVAFLPVSLRGSRSMLRVDHLREVHMAGEPTADYTGFVCDPRWTERGVTALADHLVGAVSWDRLRFEELHDPRMPMLMARMPAGFHVVEHEGTACPRMSLPATWGQYMAGLSYSTRQSLRKRIRKAEGLFRHTRFDGVDDEEQIDGLIRMAINRTRAEPDPHIWRLHSMLRRCALAGIAHMTMLWQGETPVAGVSGLINRKTGSFGLYVTAFDERYSEHSPGRVAVALAIRDAIDMGLREFDFLRGEEPYKFQFGAVSGHNRTLTIERPTLQAALRRSINGVRQSLRI